MSADTFLILGSALLLILALGQLLVQRKRSANYWLCALFVVSFLWSAHAGGYRLGAIERFPHLNKVYLPLLCLTGSFWYNYVRSLFDVTAQRKFERREFLPALACVVLSIPFYVQDETFKRRYIEVDVSDVPTATMYAASRLAELTLIFFFIRTLSFLRNVDKSAASGKGLGVTQFLWLFTLIALTASIIRFFGSIAGSETVSVIVPSLIAIGVFLGMHFLSYRIPTVLSLGRAGRQVRTCPDGAAMLDTYRDHLRAERWFLDPDLKVQSLARRLGTPPQELSALINTAAGINFNGFINELRIEYAKELLQAEPNMSILDICFASGFNSKNTFNSCFKAQMSMTPTEYRRTVTKTATASSRIDS